MPPLVATCAARSRHRNSGRKVFAMSPNERAAVDLYEKEVRDVGVAGSNPVTPTIDLINIFLESKLLGSRLNEPLGSNWGPLSTPGNHASFRLCLDANGRTESMVAGYDEIPCEIPFDAAVRSQRCSS